MTSEEINVNSKGSAPLFYNDLPLPPRGNHPSSNSDVPLGFSAMMQSSPQLVPISGQGSSARANHTGNNLGNNKKISIDSIARIKTEGDVADDMLDSYMSMDHTYVVKRSVSESAAPQFQHQRSLSMDSSIVHFHFDDSDRPGQLSRSNLLSENLAKIDLGFGSGEFNEFELKKIMSDERLAEIVSSDPKRVKRILANRQSAARSKERKMRYISELEHKVRTLQTEATTLSTQITILQKDNADLANLNNELKLHIQAMQQQAQLRDALHDTLMAEVQHLKRANMECREDEAKPNDNAYQTPTKHRIQ